MSRTMVLRGICAACKFGPDCVNHHGAEVMQCAQFEDVSWAQSDSSNRAIPVREVTDVGLCPRCRVEMQCSLPRAESGVWRCEEFAL